MEGKDNRGDEVVTQKRKGVEIRLLVQPRASRTELVGRHGDAVRVRIAAPPVGGKANEELVRFLARLLSVSKQDVVLSAGATSRRKTVLIVGVSASAVREKLKL